MSPKAARVWVLIILTAALSLSALALYVAAPDIDGRALWPEEIYARTTHAYAFAICGFVGAIAGFFVAWVCETLE